MSKVLDQCHNVDIFDIPPWFFRGSYVETPDWWDPHELSHSILVPSTSVSAYQYFQLFFGSGIEIHNVMAVARMEFVAMKVVCFLNCARGGTAWNVAKYDPRLRNNTGLLHPIVKDTRKIFDNIGFMDLGSRTEFDSVLSLLAWRRSYECD